MQMNPLSDSLSTIDNAEKSGKLKCTVEPASKLIGNVLNVMQENDYIGGYELVEDNKGGKFEVTLNGNINKCKSIKPQFSTRKDEFEKWEKRFLPGRDFGVLILTTSKGVRSHREARKDGIGGKLLAYVY
ncbi:MAG: Ribosomal protein S8 [Candidatus Methanohalarchaeum thermophilum]|uniref:Small ribosomal subunit protein uS8 n=1 Tax=Methanohalarchaeum thermophilum TaxID=1903181 RepID=A0A1Q6DX30_METT1|nr:MAG: Ribosomal protein S8 [Candidatus Methanohalarchaeum thermophilum]